MHMVILKEVSLTINIIVEPIVILRIQHSESTRQRSRTTAHSALLYFV